VGLPGWVGLRGWAEWVDLPGWVDAAWAGLRVWAALRVAWEDLREWAVRRKGPLRLTRENRMSRRLPLAIPFLLLSTALACTGVYGFASDGGLTDATVSPDANDGGFDTGGGHQKHDAGPHGGSDAGTGHRDASGHKDAAADASPCGVMDAACCPGDTCDDGGCCVDQACVANGGVCGDSLGACAVGACGTCGALGQRCCEERASDDCTSATANCQGCTAAGTTCATATGTCAACGTSGIVCCGGDKCLAPFTACIGGLCSTKCGSAGEQCCQGDTCEDGGCCMAKGTTTVCVASPTCGCTAGACTSCGLAGRACCTGSECQVGQGTCAASTGGGGSTCMASPGH
jgi:hypothetical protein